MDDLLNEDDSGYTIHDVRDVAAQDTAHFLGLVNLFCREETKQATIRSLKAWGIDTAPYVDEATETRPARIREPQRMRTPRR